MEVSEENEKYETNRLKILSLEHVRLRYSTIINFSSILYRIAISFVYVLLIARNLREMDFGLWGVVVSLSTFLSNIIMLWAYWAQRHIVIEIKEKRTMGVGLTGLSITLVYALLELPIYLLILQYSTNIEDYGVNVIVSSIFVVISLTFMVYFNMLMTTIKPEIIGLSNYVMETVRVLLAFSLVIYMKLGIIGALLSFAIGVLAKASILIYYTLKYMYFSFRRFNKVLAIKWFQTIYLPLMELFSQNIVNVDRTLASGITHSSMPATYMNVAYVIRRPIMSSSFAFTSSLYASLLRKPRKEYIEEILRLQLLPSVFIITTTIMLAKVIAALLNPIYVQAYVLLAIMSVTSMLWSLESTFLNTIAGSEGFDKDLFTKNRISLKNTYIFKANIVRISRNTIALTVATLLSVFFTNDYFNIALIYILSWFITSMASMPVIYALASKVIKIHLPRREIIAYIIASIATTSYYVISRAYVIETTRILYMVPRLLIHITIGALIYMSITLALSPWFRNIVRKIFLYIFK